MNKKIISIVIMLIMLTMLPLQAFAMEEVSVELPFAVDKINGTVVIEAVDGAPLPELTEFNDVAEGVFKLSFTQPDTYHYRVYQHIPENTDGVIYDQKVYNVVVSVFSDEEGKLYSVCTVSIDGFSEKREKVVFSNSIPYEEEETTAQTTLPNTTAPTTTSQDPPPNTGDNNNLVLWIIASLISLAGIFLTLIAARRKKVQ